MTMGKLTSRQCDVITVTLDTTLDDTPAIQFEGYAGGAIFNEASHASTGYTFYGSWAKDGTFVEILTTAGASTAISGMSASNCAPFPDQCFPFPWLKIVPQADDAETFHIALKT
jgi:hypothetical protein